MKSFPVASSSAGGKLLSSAQLFDVYRDEKRVGAGKRSMAYALEYRASPIVLLPLKRWTKQHARLIKEGMRRYGCRSSKDSSCSWQRLLPSSSAKPI